MNGDRENGFNSDEERRAAEAFNDRTAAERAAGSQAQEDPDASASGQIPAGTPEAGREGLTPAEIQDSFRARTFLVIEDGPARWDIEDTLRKERGTSQDAADGGVIVAPDYEEFEKVLAQLFVENGPRHITAIHDLQIPDFEDTIPLPRVGEKAVRELQRMVGEWNTQHPDRSVSLEQVINSSKVNSLVEAREKFGESVLWSSQKQDAPQVVKQHIESQGRLP